MTTLLESNEWSRFLLAEEEALRLTLGGIRVSDERNGDRPVGVWFGQPDVELRSQLYPFVTIDLLTVRRAAYREMRGRVRYRYLVDGAPPVGLGEHEDLIMDTPIPMDLDYQLRLFSRHPRHDRQIIATLLGPRSFARMGALVIPSDGTKRTLELLATTASSKTDGGKRLYLSTLWIRIASEVLAPEMELSTRIYAGIHAELEHSGAGHETGRFGDLFTDNYGADLSFSKIINTPPPAP